MEDRVIVTTTRVPRTHPSRCLERVYGVFIDTWTLNPKPYTFGYFDTALWVGQRPAGHDESCRPCHTDCT